MRNVQQITKMNVPEFPPFEMDALQESVMANLHVELILEGENYIVTPKNEVKPVSQEPNGAHQAEMMAFVVENSDLLEKLKTYLILNLSVYSGLIESNSYLITYNNHLVIARFDIMDEQAKELEVQLYTLEELDTQQYKDKIYIGRDFINLDDFHRKYFGLKAILASAGAEFDNLKSKHTESNLGEESESYIQDIEASINDIKGIGDRAFEVLPDDISLKTDDREILKQANMHFREIKHCFQDIRSSLRDWERFLYENEQDHFVRYVTKFKKDVSDNIDFINAKVNSRITDHINKVGEVNF